MITKFIVVREKGLGDATARLQSEPLLLGLKKIAGVEISLHRPSAGKLLAVDSATCLIFHYDDAPAVSAIRQALHSREKAVVACLCSDIYSYSYYIDLDDIVDFYLAPTEPHRKILANQLYKPVYTLKECIDPVALGARSGPHAEGFPAKSAKRAVWFGYAESFDKSMTSLMPIIQHNVAERRLDDFGLIVDQRKFLKRYPNEFNLRTIDYDVRKFSEHASRFDYAILSHFPLDLRVNSAIKSPNKAVTALLAGLVPICSDTPNYQDLFQRHGLERFLFSSALELDTILRTLDPLQDSRAISGSGIISALLEEGSPGRISEAFLEIMACYQSREVQPEYSTLSPKALPPSTGLLEHVTDLIPSAVRMIKSRVRRV